MTNEDNTFAAWVESPFHMEWRENLTEHERAMIFRYVELATREIAKFNYEHPQDVILIAKMSMMLDTLTRLNERTEALRMELLMPRDTP